MEASLQHGGDGFLGAHHHALKVNVHDREQFLIRQGHITSTLNIHTAVITSDVDVEPVNV